MQQAPRRRLLTKIENTVPIDYYYDPAHYERELSVFFYRNWLYVCRSDQLSEPRDFVVEQIGSQEIVITRDLKGRLSAFHNTCRHRGSILCTKAQGRFEGGTIVCPYHAWTYSLEGDLIATPHQLESADFQMAEHSLYRVAVGEWGGYVFVNLAGDDAAPFEQALGDMPERFKNYHVDQLIVGDTMDVTLDCNWKLFWENFSECFHCPNVHPELCEIVPTYGKGILSPWDDPNYQPAEDSGDGRSRMGEGHVTWTVDGQTGILFFKDITPEEAAMGFSYGTMRPGFFMAVHPDYIRAARILPRGPEKIDLRMEWLFEAETLAQDGFDLEHATELGRLVVVQDGDVCEVNQKGLRSNRHTTSVLMPQEYGVLHFNRWVLEQLGETVEDADTFRLPSEGGGGG